MRHAGQGNAIMMMNLPYVTAFYAALIGLLAAVLTVLVIAGRTRFVVAAGDGGNAALAQAILAHANLAEQAPLVLLVIGFAEASGLPKPYIHVLGIVLVAARILSAVGLSRSLADTLPRRAGAGLTILTLVAASGLILLRFAGLA
jgi:uncharacterized membrane protein YecN with MAPEG domain